MKHSLLGKKVSWTIFIVFIYMLGRSIPLATVPLDAALFENNTTKDLMSALASVSGGQFTMTALFTLGIGPNMTMILLWRSLSVFKVPFITSMTKRRVWFWQNVLTLLIAAVQALGLTSQLDYTVASPLLGRVSTIVFLITGTLVLTWLTQVNTKYGLGGSVVIILVNMCLNLLQTVFTFFADADTNNLILFLITICGMISLLLALVFLTVVAYRAEYRIPLMRISIHNRFYESTYIPVRLMPAGGMPFMYSMTLMTLPPLAIQALLGFSPDSSLLWYLSENSSIDRLPGLCFYIVILYALSIGFAYFNYDAQEMAKNFRRHGDYVASVRPGKDTQRYLQKRIRLFSHIGALCVLLIGGVPALLNFYTDSSMGLALFISNIFIIVSLVMTVIEQIDALRIWEKYKPLI